MVNIFKKNNKKINNYLEPHQPHVVPPSIPDKPPILIMTLKDKIKYDKLKKEIKNLEKRIIKLEKTIKYLENDMNDDAEEWIIEGEIRNRKR